MSWNDDTLDTALLLAWREGDKTAADRLISRYGPRLYNFFAGKVTGGADELCHRTLSDWEAGRGSTEPEGSRDSVRSGLFAAARRRLLEHFEEPGARSVHPCEHSVAELNVGASELMVAREQQRRLQLALRQLPLDAQIALELHFWEGLTAAEIAGVVETTEETISARLTDARHKLRERLEHDRELTEHTIDALMTEDERRRR